MLTLLFYERDHDLPTPTIAIEEALSAQGVTFEAGPDAPYRPGRWHDPVTGARAIIDVGVPVLEGDEDPHPPTTYLGWRALPLTIQIPLAGPHWHAVEALTMVEAVLARLPGVEALDTEDTRADDDADAGPYAWSRPRRIAHWEALRTANDLTCPKLDRGASLRLWRWRRERAAAAMTHPDLAWPEAVVLWDREENRARTAALLPTGSQPLALPPVDLLVRPAGPTCHAIQSRRDGPWAERPALPAGGRQLAAADLEDLGPALPLTRFAALLDEDWQD